MPPEWIHSNIESSVPAEISEQELACEKFAEALQAAIGTPRYRKWFEGRSIFSLQGDVLTIGLASPFMIKFMIREFREIALATAQRLLGLSLQVRFEVDERATGMSVNSGSGSVLQTVNMARSMKGTSSAALVGTDAEPDPGLLAFRESGGTETSSAPRVAPRRRRFARLDDFIPGSGNQAALSMARLVAEQPGERYNPLYLYGGVGIGKTHLLEGIHAEIRLCFPELTTTYLTAEAFANYYTKALREKTLPAFRRKFRSIDALLVDDIDFLDAKKGIQEEFCHTIQDLLAYGRQIVLAADRHPKMLTNVRPELCSRFLSGLVTRLEAPDEQNRRDIVRQRAVKMALPITDEAIEHIARKFTRNTRELLGAVNCMRTYHQMTGRAISLSATRDALRDFERDCLRIVRAADIQHAVCELFGVHQQDLISPKRTRQLAQPRMLAMYLTRQWTNAAYHEIGKQFGGRNHSTVMSAERKMKEMLQRNSSMQISAREWTAQEIVCMLEEQLQVG